VSACGLLALFIAHHCQVKLNAMLYSVDIFLMQHTMREVYYNEIATFRSANICLYQHGTGAPLNVRSSYVSGRSGASRILRKSESNIRVVN
jgi:hypothetical protein